MVYYAFLKWQTSEPNYRYLLTAPDAETIDEWWREASTKDLEHVKRLGPDFYSWDSGAQAWDLAPSFLNRIIYTLLNDRDGRIISNFAQPPRVSVLSGDSYYIRSKSSPELYWLEKGGLIYATKQGRTRFTFRLDGERDSDRNRTVIIGKDYISVSAVGGSAQKYVSVNDNGEVVLSGHSCRMYYSDLKNMYLAQGEAGDLKSATVMKTDGFGEEWELVK
ncbi:hypothetical protein FDENT_639 [Fusarium denticulatum]|uniref:Uncharacterized protein n=1 Tax=Fusarium denticulatum TaxID=48507 RepID=A0A8H5XKC2_9HYPO|nr:hypothetical protein FDENT_639 [Fusarium denticulatum]